MADVSPNIPPPPTLIPMGTIERLGNHFLVAMPALVDPNFGKTVVLVVEHTPKGALGLVLNRPMDINMSSLFERLDLKPDQPFVSSTPVFFGGPAQADHGFVLHEPVGTWGSTVHVGESLGLTSSRDILEAVASGNGPEKFFVTLGYAGWGPGQLEEEILNNAWLTVPAEATLIFEIPVHQRFEQACRMLGIEDPSALSLSAGHA